MSSLKFKKIQKAAENRTSQQSKGTSQYDDLKQMKRA